MLAAYFDDSGTHNASRVVCWGGFIATTQQWAGFNAAWRAKLIEPLEGKLPIRRFSLAQCHALAGPFAGYSRTEAELLQNELRQIIVDHRLLGMAFGVERDAWDRLVQGDARRFLGDAEVVSFSACFNAAIEKAPMYFPEERHLSLHFDKGRQSPKLNAVVEHVKAKYFGAPELVNISFDVVEKATPLQAADILATENFWHAQSILDGKLKPRPHFAHFLQRISTEGYILQEADVWETLKSHGFA